MKIYCSCCDKVQSVRIDNCRDAKTNEPYQDIVCAECDLVIASGTDIAQPEQEPVAWINPDEQNARKAFHWVKAEEFTSPVYTTPPQRTWVGLTDEEENEYNYLGPDMHWVIQEIAAKLKQKNTHD